jgi:heavy metal translocating P-type ATPase
VFLVQQRGGRAAQGCVSGAHRRKAAEKPEQGPVLIAPVVFARHRQCDVDSSLLRKCSRHGHDLSYRGRQPAGWQLDIIEILDNGFCKLAAANMLKRAATDLRPVLVAIPAAGLALGFVLSAFGHGEWSAGIWAASTLPVLAILLFEIVSSLRRGDVGLDIVAALSMTAALFFGEALAACVVALMYAGGQYLESYAEGHARREMTALLSRVPRSAVRHRNGQLEDVPIDAIATGDHLLIRQGDVVPVDGKVASGIAVLDQSALTGESLPVQQATGQPVMSGSTNVGEAFDLIAARRAAESTYAGIVRLVEAAQRSKAPMSRLADRFAIAFLALTVVIAGAAWFLSGDPIRAVAVLVVATPCPLILAVPVAIVSGLSRAAKHGILVKGGGALENMSRVRVLVVDKTGTLTHGRARIVGIQTAAGFSANELARVAASLDQASKHIIAQTIVAYARQRGLRLAVPVDVVETPGEGIEGRVEGKCVVVGGTHFVASKLSDEAETSKHWSKTPGAVTVSAAVDGRLAGEFILADELRTGTLELLRNLRRLGLDRIVLATGDRREVAEAVVAGLGFDAVRSELTPDQKVMLVLSERKNGPVMMVGDGVNDAPALAAADIGVAMGAGGAAASAEVADVVLLVDQLDRIVPAIEIARRSRLIALESVYAGIGLSILGMIFATAGYITPVQGALLQEAIDVAVILNALRTLNDGKWKIRG